MKAKKLFPDLSFKRLWDRVIGIEDKVNKQDENLAVRYNSETGMMQIYDENIWKDWKIAKVDGGTDILRLDGVELTASSQYDDSASVSNLLLGGLFNSGPWESATGDENAIITCTFPKQVAINSFRLISIPYASDTTNIEVQVSDDLVNYKSVGTFSYLIDPAAYNSDYFRRYLNNIKCKSFRIKFLNSNFQSRNSCIITALSIAGRIVGEEVDIEGRYQLEKETIVGTWIDGSPIYRRVLIDKIPTGSVNSDSYYIECAAIIKQDGFIFETGGYIIPFGDNELNASFLASSGFESIGITLKEALDHDVYFYVIVDYVKTIEWLPITE